MLKRQQVLFEHWMVDYLKETSKHMQISCSEAVRILVCFGAATIISARYRSQKKLFDEKKIISLINQHSEKKLSPIALSQIIGDFYHEARKLMIISSENLKKINKRPVSVFKANK
jgi:hypothetical protein